MFEFNGKNHGFTLAEVLITLSVIGLVAALTIPQLVKNLSSYVFQKSQDIAFAKIKEATSEMKSNDVLSGYTTNDAFVDEFQKYMKITKRCDSSNLTSCFPAKFKSGTEDIDTTTLTTGKKLGANNITGNTIGLMLANGTSILFTLRDPTKVGSDCDRIDPTDNQANTTSCLSFLYDVNGYGQPNIIGKDIVAVNASISSCDGTKIGALCISGNELPMPVAPINTCDGSPNLAWDSRGSTNPYCANNRWAAAKKLCDAKSMRLPTVAELKTVLYPNVASIGTVVSGDPTWALYNSFWSSETYPGYPKDARGVNIFTGEEIPMNSAISETDSTWSRTYCVSP